MRLDVIIIHFCLVASIFLAKKKLRMATTTVAPVVGIPVKILHEAEGHIVSCETIMGETYRGKLIEAEDNMNLQMQG